MLNFLEHILSIFSDDDEDGDKYKYNYQYIAPLAMIDKVPGLGFSLKWAAMVGFVLLKTLINQMAIKLDEDLSDLTDDMEKVKTEIDQDDILKALACMFVIVGKLRIKDANNDLKDLELVFKDMPLTLNADKAGREYLIRVGGSIFGALKDTTPNGHLNSLEEYQNMYRFLPLPAIASTFQDNNTFADMQVAGPNPMMLTRLTSPLAKFPITEAQYQAVMGSHDSLADAMASGRAYIVDFAILNGALLGTFPMNVKYMPAPIAMYAVPKDGADRKLKVVGIQCEQEPGPANPVWTTPPTGADESTRMAWEMAKSVVLEADGNMHEAVYHLGQTHMVVEPFVVATMNELKEDHPIYRLLTPHFEGTLFINSAAHTTLLKAGGVIDKIMGGTIQMSLVVAGLGAQQVLFNFDKSYLRESLKNRGVDDTSALPYFPYRDCALQVWDAIHKWVSDYLALYYPNETSPEADKDLQDWLEELTSLNGGRVRSLGERDAQGNLKFITRKYLANALTMVIYTGSAQHAAVNFPQSYIMSYTPAMPLATYSPVPDPNKTYTYQDWMNQLPPYEMTMQQLNTGTLLGSVYYTTLGQYDKDWFPAEVNGALKKFQHHLTKLDKEFLKTYGDAYRYLRPSEIPQSINI